jgi:pyruvate/2-oxoglutarate dehydrogenase complex dihydrolipoamide dehydrogenase (E3) component
VQLQSSSNCSHRRDGFGRHAVAYHESARLVHKEKVVVVGAGLGGTLSAIQLARFGYDVTIVEARPLILDGASKGIWQQNAVHKEGSYSVHLF